MTKKRRRRSGRIVWKPSGTGQPLDLGARGAGLNLEAIDRLVALVDDDDVAQALDAYRDTLVRSDRHADTERPRSRHDVERDVRAAHQAAARTGEPLALSHSDVQAAEAAEADYAATTKALNAALGRCNHELHAALNAAAPAALQVLAREREQVVQRGDDPGHVPSALHAFATSFRWPFPDWYQPAHVSPDGKGFVRWWPLILGGPHTVSTIYHAGPDREQRLTYNEDAWQVWAHPPRGDVTLEDLQQAMYAIATKVRYTTLPRPRGYEPNDLVPIGTGPNGERGVTKAELRAVRAELKPVTYG